MLLNQSFFKNDAFQEKDIPTELANSLDAICNRFYRPADNRFDYASFATSKEFNHHTTVARALNDFDPISLVKRGDRISFWLNVYNALLLHAIVMREVKESVIKASGFYNDTYYKIGPHQYTLDEIEHGILRGNSKKYRCLMALLGRTDLRLPLIIQPIEPLIHFGLYSASFSSPFLQVYRPEMLMEQLNDGMQLVLARDAQFSIENYELVAPKIFYWYEKDFGTRENVIQLIGRFLPNPQDRLFALEHATHVTLHYAEFDWRLNQI